MNCLPIHRDTLVFFMQRGKVSALAYTSLEAISKIASRRAMDGAANAEGVCSPRAQF
ncbi:MAG: hypothetical protein K1X79_11445 [Oligoflexia bacterium]|nr:hypothetical protein [Oligoflexia bacterium]